MNVLKVKAYFKEEITMPRWVSWFDNAAWVMLFMLAVIQ